MPKKFLTVKEVARLLEVTPLTVRNWDARGKLMAHRHPMNNYRMYKTEDVEELLKEFQISKVAKKVPNPLSKPPSLPPAVAPIAASAASEKPQIRKLKIDVY